MSPLKQLSLVLIVVFAFSALGLGLSFALAGIAENEEGFTENSNLNKRQVNDKGKKYNTSSKMEFVEGNKSIVKVIVGSNENKGVLIDKIGYIITDYDTVKYVLNSTVEINETDRGVGPNKKLFAKVEKVLVDKKLAILKIDSGDYEVIDLSKFDTIQMGTKVFTLHELDQIFKEYLMQKTNKTS